MFFYRHFASSSARAIFFSKYLRAPLDPSLLNSEFANFETPVD
jgi:hypothetical protein